MPLGAAVGSNSVSSETTKQVKCCGDMPVRHTGVVGFNSHHLLDPTGLPAPPRGQARGVPTPALAPLVGAHGALRFLASLAQLVAAAAWYAAGRRFDSGGGLDSVSPRSTPERWPTRTVHAPAAPRGCSEGRRKRHA